MYQTILKNTIIKTLLKYIICLFLFCFLTQIILAQTNENLCTEIHNGIFYFYPKNSEDKFVMVREGDLQKESNITTGDTIMWKVSWIDDCTYALKFISTNSIVPTENLKILKKHPFIYNINDVQANYYSFTGFLGKQTTTAFQKDTLWLNEKINIESNKLFISLDKKIIKSIPEKQGEEKFAVINIYRPQKITNSLVNYLIYFDDNIMWAARNNSGCSFKIFKEGNFNVRSNLLKDQSSVAIDIKFGNIYYIKSMIHWGISSNLYNFKLEMKTIPAAKAANEFEEVKLR